METPEPTARMGSRVVTEAEVRAFCAAVGLPYPLPGDANDGSDNDRQPRTGHGVRMPDRRRRVARPAGVRRPHLAHGGEVRATPPAVEPMTVRDARRRERLHLAGQWAIVFAIVLGITVLGLWGSWDRQPLGESRTPAQEGMER